ncbi:MAG TPA: hypothetical protein VH437_19585 [Terriglobales bacterium]|jgi:hypothetical protein
MTIAAAEEIVAEAQRKGDLIGVRVSSADDDAEQDPWSSSRSRKQRELSIEGPLSRNVQIVRANLVYEERAAAGHVESAASLGGLSEPRVLQSSGDAPLDMSRTSCP